MMKRIADLAKTLVLLIVFAATALAGEYKTPEKERASLEIAGISATTGEDEPRILFILPWQPPSLPRRLRAELADQAPELEQPIDPMAVERHRRFRNTLDPMTLDPQGIQP
ncbi:hypothetical protein DET50_12161 [Marinobacter pelagius]|uniref:Uncharacterized protein n=1 Tax=Marinobacter pelagius TaxID=379482 RepID=A0A366GFJ7_9GAMM|nr:hypothetical protein [Marinobacter pelagius]RBP25718.1 hypothetical protein DET50_12161 [Marinobacter pelagius]